LMLMLCPVERGGNGLRPRRRFYRRADCAGHDADWRATSIVIRRRSEKTHAQDD